MPITRSYADHGDACATAHAMELLGDRWTYPVLRELMLAPKRFTELKTTVRGITPAVLTARLRTLETSGLVQKITLPPPARVAAYELTSWARQLRPIFEELGRWAQASPVWHTDGCGLTPDAIVQSMLTMAPRSRLTPPVVLALRLHDERGKGVTAYDYRLSWGDTLTITREPAPDATAVVTGDSTAWTEILYNGRPLTDVTITGDASAVVRVVEAFKHRS